MIQLIINSNLLREIDERKLINRYARFCYNDDNDVNNEIQIKQNLEKLLDWDYNGESGVPTYCSKFESIKRKDWIKLIQFIRDNKEEIKSIAYMPLKQKQLKNKKIVLDTLEKKEARNKERFTDQNYKVSGRGITAKPCNYKGRIYKSRQECMYKEGITQNQLYRYLEKTKQV